MNQDKLIELLAKENLDLSNASSKVIVRLVMKCCNSKNEKDNKLLLVCRNLLNNKSELEILEDRLNELKKK